MDIFRQVAAAALVFGLLGAMLWRLRRGGFASFAAVKTGNRRLRSIERLALGPNQALHLVRLGDRCFLVATSASGASVIEKLPWEEFRAQGEGA